MTLLPDKHVTMRRSLIGTGAHLLRRLSSPQTFNSLWESVKAGGEVANFKVFLLSLDYLYTIGAVDYEHGFLSRTRRGDQ